MLLEHVLSLLYKISRTIHALLPALHELKHSAAVEIRSCTSQPATHDFLSCVVILVVLPRHVISRPWVRGGLRGPIRTVWWVLEHFTAVLRNRLRRQTSSVRSCVVVLKDERQNVTNRVNEFPFRQKVIQYASFRILEDNYLNFGRRRYSSGIFPFWTCRVMPCHALSFHFWVDTVEPAIVTSHDDEQKSSPSAACRRSICDNTSMRAFCVRP